ncbi:MAG TPA: PEP-CTERM sorting domain-containing protein [Verrucomicrobiae bacterium]|jgi:hypothetical protein
MKKTMAAIVLLAGACAGYSQGTIDWSDYVPAGGPDPGFSITVFSPGPGGVEQNLGNTANGTDLPPGTATYFGVPLASGQGGDSGPTGYANGFNFTIGLYAGTSPEAVQSSVQLGQPVATSDFSVGGGGWNYTSIIATMQAQNGFAPGDQIYFELAAWYSGDGGATSYSQAVANGLANDPAGFSSISSPITLGGPNDPANLDGSGITDFSLATAPEPSTLALGLFGASALLMRMRRKQ